MNKKVKKKSKPSILSRNPYQRREESEMIKIINQIQSGILKKREACRKYGISRNTLVNWIQRLSVRTVSQEAPNELLCSMTDKQQDRALHKKIKELTQALEQAKLKTESLETMIKVAEEELQIKIRKKHGTRQ